MVKEVDVTRLLKRPVLLAIGAVAIAASITTPLAFSRASAHLAISGDLYVSPSGSNKATGTTSSHPLKTIQSALNEAAPGATIHLAAGSYHERPVTKVSGTASQPITVEGDPSVLTELWNKGRIFTINNSYYRVQGFTIEGEHGLSATYPTALTAATAFKSAYHKKIADSTMIFIGAKAPKGGVTGVVINDMRLLHAGGDCLRMRGDATHNTVENSTIQWCGMHGKYAGKKEFEYHNGEGVYIGTSPRSTDQPSHSDDTSSFNVVQHNIIDTFGSECLDVKENAHNNTFVHNTCADNTEPLSDEGSNIELRGYNNSIIGNTITGSLGYGLKLASDSPKFPQGGNVAENNEFAGDTGAPIVNKDDKPQSVFCGNSFGVKAYVTGASVGAATKACSAS